MITPIANMTGAFEVKGKNVVVTGGNRGIGLGITTAFMQSGANVAILCRNKESGDSAAESLKHNGGKCFCIQCDTGDFMSVKTAIAEVYKIFDHVDVLVNNAGVSTVCKFVDDKELSEWTRVMNTNINGPAYMIYEVAPKMMDYGKGGSIINISSIGGSSLCGTMHHPKMPYHVAKAGLNMLTQGLAVEFGDYGIRVNAIAPGPTHSDLDNDLPPQAHEKIKSDMPMHRFGEPIEIGALCVFLASPAGCQITGTVTNHDGGIILGG